MGQGGRSGRREVTLVTLFGAYKRQYHKISGDLFDQVTTKEDKMNNRTQQQPISGRRLGDPIQHRLRRHGEVLPSL